MGGDEFKVMSGFRPVDKKYLSIAGRFLEPCFAPEHSSQRYPVPVTPVEHDEEYCGTCGRMSMAWCQARSLAREMLMHIDGETRVLFMISRVKAVFTLDR